MGWGERRRARGGLTFSLPGLGVYCPLQVPLTQPCPELDPGMERGDEESGWGYIQ